MEESITKIIATIGPASDSKEKIRELISHHMNMARLNFSWGTYPEYEIIIKNIRQAALELSKKIYIVQDLSGPRVQEEGSHHFGGEQNEQITTDKDIADLTFGIEQGVDYVAQSFVGTAEDVKFIKNIIKEKGGHQKVIAKIERRLGYENLVEIVEASDAIMVARGDLGNEFPLEEIPFIQHNIIKEANRQGKLVIVATQMMLSMTENITPTRAEVSDVAYAIIEGADAVMLSEESAKGKHPIETVAMMEKIALSAEKHMIKKDIIII